MGNTTYTHKCLAHYEQRLALAAAALPGITPWTEEGREEAASLLLESLGIKKDWAPGIRTRSVRTTECRGYRIEHLCFTSWPQTYGAANLYIPGGGEGPFPWVLLCCGHGAGGKLHGAYQKMAQAIVRSGASVLVPDNIGQGERTPMPSLYRYFVAGCDLEDGSYSASGNSEDTTLWAGGIDRSIQVEMNQTGSFSEIRQRQKEIGMTIELIPGEGKIRRISFPSFDVSATTILTRSGVKIELDTSTWPPSEKKTPINDTSEVPVSVVLGQFPDEILENPSGNSRTGLHGASTKRYAKGDGSRTTTTSFEVSFH